MAKFEKAKVRFNKGFSMLAGAHKEIALGIVEVVQDLNKSDLHRIVSVAHAKAVKFIEEDFDELKENMRDTAEMERILDESYEQQGQLYEDGFDKLAKLLD